LDRRHRELADQQATIAKAKDPLARDRQDLERQKGDLSDKQAQATKLVDDKGFQDSLALYNGERTLLLTVQKSQDENTIAVIDGLKATLDEMRRSCPRACGSSR